jgi:hypothetical protein
MGRMSKSSKISIQSILDLAVSESITVYIFADTPGKKWILDNFTNEKQFIFVSIELDKLSNNQKDRFRPDFQANNSRFGTDEMKLITPFKWEGIIKVFEINPSLLTLIVTDIDVIWKRNPMKQIESLINSTYFALIQDDTPKGSSGYYCTGIQIWQNNSNVIIYLKSLLDFHKDSHSKGYRYRGMLLGDEKAFNLWMAKNKSSEYFFPLKRNDFVIGHRVKQAIIRLLVNKWPIAVHANYTLSETLKFHKLNAFNKGLVSWKSRILVLISPKRLKF